MEPELTLTEYVSRADEFATDDRTPFAETPWTPESLVIFKESDRTDPIVEDGKVFGYFLEASVIQEIREWPTDESPEAFVTRVIKYAEYDA